MLVCLLICFVVAVVKFDMWRVVKTTKGIDNNVKKTGVVGPTDDCASYNDFT